MATNYPPYNIKKLDETSQVLAIALAGFSKEDIEVAVEKGVLTVTAKQEVDEGWTFHSQRNCIQKCC